MENLTAEQTKRNTLSYTTEERLDMLTRACVRYEKDFEVLFKELGKLTNALNEVKTLNQNLDNPIIATIKNVYQLEDYDYKDKVLTVYLVEFDEFIDKLYLHRIKGNLDGLFSGAKATFKIDGDRIKDFRSIKNTIN